MPVWDDVRAPRHGPYRPGHRTVPTDTPQEESQPSPAAATYRREARRLRQRYAGQPELLQAGLRDLSRKHDRIHRQAKVAAEPAPSPRLRPVVERVHEAAVPPVPSFGQAVVNWFADRVAATVDSRLLLFSERHALLKTAERLGIDRFHANLIVAVAQHQAEERGVHAAAPASTANSSFVRWVTVVTVQTLIISALWWILR